MATTRSNHGSLIPHAGQPPALRQDYRLATAGLKEFAGTLRSMESHSHVTQAEYSEKVAAEMPLQSAINQVNAESSRQSDPRSSEINDFIDGYNLALIQGGYAGNPNWANGALQTSLASEARDLGFTRDQVTRLLDAARSFSISIGPTRAEDARLADALQRYMTARAAYNQAGATFPENLDLDRYLWQHLPDFVHSAQTSP